jgi:phage FluMu protein Com
LSNVALFDGLGRQPAIGFLPSSAATLGQAPMAERPVALPPVWEGAVDGFPIFHLSDKQAPTGIETDVQSLQAAWKATLKVKCPYCGEVHEISVRETYINGALQDATDRLRRSI